MDFEKFGGDYFSRFKHEKSMTEWRAFRRKQISEIQKYVKGETKICDVGCGLGAFLEMCDKIGWSTFGIDVSEYAIKEAKKRTKAKLVVFDIQNGVPFEEEFDVMTYFDVVEHLTNPGNAIANASLKLKKGGILIITTPNLKSGFWRGISAWQEDETHISLKKPEEWKKILEETGFRVISLRTIFPVLQYKGGVKAFAGKLFAKVSFGSTLYILALKAL